MEGVEGEGDDDVEGDEEDGAVVEAGGALAVAGEPVAAGFGGAADGEPRRGEQQVEAGAAEQREGREDVEKHDEYHDGDDDGGAQMRRGAAGGWALRLGLHGGALHAGKVRGELRDVDGCRPLREALPPHFGG